MSGQNYERITEAFLNFGMPVFDMTADNFLYNTDLNVFSFGRSPVSIEILKEITGLSFNEVYDQAIETEIEGVALKIINLNHLKENKKQSVAIKI